MDEGRKNNISLLRLLGAVFVLWGHSYALVYGPGGGEDPVSEFTRSFSAFSLGLPGYGVSLFFLLSGYLISRSFNSGKGLLRFAEARILRIYPALIVVVVLSVFFLGPIATTLSLEDYFSHKGTWSYLISNSSLSSVQYRLPGVFSENPRPGVNGSLWTLPVELWMYLLVVFFGVLGVFSSKLVFNFFLVFVLLAYSISNGDFILLEKVSHARLAVFFLIGCFFYVNACSIPLTLRGGGASILIAFIFKDSRFFELIFCLSLSYLFLLFAYHPKLKLPSIDRFGDFSYGIYIYAFPVQQTFIWMNPGASVWMLNALTIPLIFALAFFSWHLIEKRCIGIRVFSRKEISFQRKMV